MFYAVSVAFCAQRICTVTPAAVGVSTSRSQSPNAGRIDQLTNVKVPFNKVALLITAAVSIQAACRLARSSTGVASVSGSSGSRIAASCRSRGTNGLLVVVVDGDIRMILVLAFQVLVRRLRDRVQEGQVGRLRFGACEMMMMSGVVAVLVLEIWR